MDDRELPLDDLGDRPSKRRRDASHRTEFGLMRRTAGQGTANFIGSASGIHFIRSVYSAAQNRTTASNTASPGGDVVPGEEDQIAAGERTARKTSLWLPSETSASILTMRYESLISWSSSYWDYWHPCLPFLYAPSVLKWFEDLANLGLNGVEGDMNDCKIAIIRSIVSISLADRRQRFDSGEVPTIIPDVLVFPSVDAAIKTVHAQLIRPPTTETLQATLAVQLFLVSMLHYNAASRIGGLVIRMAQQMGLHRCPVRFATFSSDEIALRKRLFWSLYSIDRHITQSLGLPLGLRDDDFDVCFLDSEAHSNAHEIMDTRLVVCNFISKLSAIKGRILELRNKSINHRQSDTDMSTLVSAEIAKIGNDIDEHVSMLDENTSSNSKVHFVILEVMKQECVIALNRPLLAMAKDSSDYKSGLQLCISASRSIITILASGLRDAGRGQAGNLLWPSFTWAVWMSAFVVVYAALEGEMSPGAAHKLCSYCVAIFEHLSSRGTVWPGACAAAVKELSKHLKDSDSVLWSLERAQSNAHGDSSRRSSHQTPETNSRSQRGTAKPRTPQPSPASAILNEHNASDSHDNQTVRSDIDLQQPASDNVFSMFANPAAPGEDFGFSGFDLPFWMTDDQSNYDWMRDWNVML